MCRFIKVSSVSYANDESLLRLQDINTSAKWDTK